MSESSRPVLQLIRDLMDLAVANKLTVMRAFATAVDPQYPMQSSPTAYNENMFRGLDYVLEQARLRGIKVCPSSRWYASLFLH